MGILSSLCLADTSYYSFNALLRECGPKGTHTISFRDDLPERLTTPCCVLMALATFLSKALAVVTMDVFTG